MKSILPPQPPPDAPAPPPGEESEDSRLKWKMIRVVGWASIAFAVYFLAIALPLSRAQSRKASGRLKSDASSNLRQLHLALFNFDSDYGTFPDASTIPDVKADTGTTLALGSGSSNELLRQLIATEGVKTETIFWVRTPTTPNRPNNILGTDALKKGEVSFAYVAGLSGSSITESPILMTPMIPGTDQFDPKPFDGKAMVLRVDGSVTPEPIDKHGNVMIGGMNLFDPRQPYWRGKTPDIKWPE